MKHPLLLTLLLILLTSRTQAQTDLSPKLDALLQEAAEKNVFSGNVLIQQNGKLLYEKSIGMADYANQLPNGPETRFSIGSITKLFTRLAFEPGTQAEYSNSGYVILGAIIEKVTGKNYTEVLKSRILDKIGMENTGFLFKMQNLPGKAVGYLSNQPGPRADNIGFGMLGGGDGGIYATRLGNEQLSTSNYQRNYEQPTTSNYQQY